MDLHKDLVLVRRYWRSIVATLLLGVAVAAAVSLLQPRAWTATTTLFVTMESGGTAGTPSWGATDAERQVKSFVEVATSPYVLQPVIDRLNLGTTPQQLGEDISVKAATNTSVIEISAERENPREAADIANVVADSLARAVDALSPQGQEGERNVQATVIERAVVSTLPSSPKPLQSVALGVLFGLLLGLGQALLRDRFDTRVRTVADVAQVTDSFVIGAIACHDHAPDDTDSGHSPPDEALRTLRTNLSFLGLAGQRRPSIVFTSSVEAEGKTETATRLARSLAEAGERVLLVDADLRRPRIAHRMGLEGSVGLSHVLSEQADAWDLVQPGGVPGFDVLVAGAVPPNPSELLASDAMNQFLLTAEDRYDYVLFDAPPLLPVTDAAVLANQAGGAVVVARSGLVTKHELGAALTALTAAGADVIGLVLNDVTKDFGASAYCGYYYSHRNSKAAGAAPPAHPLTGERTPAGWKGEHGW